MHSVQRQKKRIDILCNNFNILSEEFTFSIAKITYWIINHIMNNRRSSWAIHTFYAFIFYKPTYCSCSIHFCFTFILLYTLWMCIITSNELLAIKNLNFEFEFHYSCLWPKDCHDLDSGSYNEGQGCKVHITNLFAGHNLPQVTEMERMLHNCCQGRLICTVSNQSPW